MSRHKHKLQHPHFYLGDSRALNILLFFQLIAWITNVLPPGFYCLPRIQKCTIPTFEKTYLLIRSLHNSAGVAGLPRECHADPVFGWRTLWKPFKVSLFMRICTTFGSYPMPFNGCFKIHREVISDSLHFYGVSATEV